MQLRACRECYGTCRNVQPFDVGLSVRKLRCRHRLARDLTDPVGAPRLRKAERGQVSLRPLSLEDLLPPDHRARFVWSFAEGLDLSALYRAIKAVEGHPGHPPADPP